MTDSVAYRTITSARACALVARACDLAEAAGKAVCVAVADRGGHLLAFRRMDGAPILSTQLAQDKAYTVAAFGLPTHEWWPILEADESLKTGIVKTDRLVVFGGGVPVLVDGELVGAIGVSGGTAEEDRAIAEAAVSHAAS